MTAQDVPLLTDAKKLGHLTDFLAYAPDGVVVEVGVWRGGVLARLAEAFPDRRIIGYDTFSGLAEHGERDNFHRRGGFAAPFDEVSKALSRWTNVELVRGIYPASDKSPPASVALAHVDVDTYRSTYDALRHLRHRMAAGGRLYCDDAFFFECEGATLAVCRFAHEFTMPVRLDEFPAHAYFQF